jgi:hypothetical protein
LRIVFFQFSRPLWNLQGAFCAIVFGGALLAEEAVDASDGLAEAFALDARAVGAREGDEDAPDLGVEEQDSKDPLYLTRAGAALEGVEVASGGASAGSFPSSRHRLSFLRQVAVV